jgi:heme exporter protein D
MTEFLHMGGYGGFVWAAFATTFVVLVALLVVSLRGLRENEARLAELNGALSPKSARDSI